MPFLTERLSPVTHISESWKEKNLMFTNLVTFNRCIGCHHTLIPVFNFVKKMLCSLVQKSCHLELLFVVFIEVHCLEDILIKVPFKKPRLEQIRRIEALAHGLAFEPYLRQPYDSINTWEWILKSYYCKLSFILLKSKHKNKIFFKFENIVF